MPLAMEIVPYRAEAGKRSCAWLCLKKLGRPLSKCAQLNEQRYCHMEFCIKSLYRWMYIPHPWLVLKFWNTRK